MSDPAPSVDPREVQFYDRLAATWWDDTGPLRPLHGLNRFRLGYLREHLPVLLGRDPGAREPLAGLSVLDVGCGGGLLSEAVARLGARVLGVDASPRNIEVARRHARGSGLDVTYRHQDVEALAAEGGCFDVVLNMEVVEHVADLDGFMAAASALVAPGGVMAVASINRTALAWLLAIVGAEYVLRLLPRGTHQYRKLVRPAEVESRLAGAGLSVQRRTGVAFNPLRHRFRLTPRMAVNYMLLAQRALDAGGGTPQASTPKTPAAR